MLAEGEPDPAGKSLFSIIIFHHFSVNLDQVTYRCMVGPKLEDDRTFFGTLRVNLKQLLN